MEDEIKCNCIHASSFRFWIWIGGVVWTFKNGFDIVHALFWPIWLGARLAEFSLTKAISP